MQVFYGSTRGKAGMMIRQSGKSEVTTDYTNGNWHAMTLGQLISIMIDSGGDPAVLMRVVNDEPVIDGSFIRHLEITMIPQGRVTETINNSNPESIHKVLLALIRGGVVK